VGRDAGGGTREARGIGSHAPVTHPEIGQQYPFPIYSSHGRAPRDTLRVTRYDSPRPDSLPLEHHTPVRNRHVHLDLTDLVRIDGGDVGVEDGDVAELAGGEGALDALLE
jgi:hypothetical protein